MRTTKSGRVLNSHGARRQATQFSVLILFDNSLITSVFALSVFLTSSNVLLTVNVK